MKKRKEVPTEVERLSYRVCVASGFLDSKGSKVLATKFGHSPNSLRSVLVKRGPWD